MGGRGSSGGGGALKSNLNPNKTVKDRFFNNVTPVSRKYFRYDSIIDNDNIIVRTNNIAVVKGNPVLVVDNDKAIYLKSWQVEPVKMNRGEINTYAVKLNRNFMRPYTFKSGFRDFSFKKQDTFESLKNLAKKQQKQNVSISRGWGYNEEPFRR